MKCWPRRSGISETEKYITNQQIKGDEPQRGVQLLFVGFRESSHVILERFCILSLRDGITPGSTRHIRLCANLRVNSHSALWFLSSLLFFCVFSLFFCFLFGFNDLPGRPFWFAHFLVLDRIFHRKFGADWWTLHPPRAVVCRPRQTRGCSHPKGTLRFTQKILHQSWTKLISHYYSFRFVTACLAFQSHQIQKALVSRLKTLQSALFKKRKKLFH